MPSRCASRSQMAFSSAALAMGLPRTARKIRGHSPPCSGDSAASMGASSLTSTCQAVSVDSPEKYGRSPAVHSPQPVKPFRLDLGEHNSAVAGDAKAGFKRTHQRHVEFAQNNCINSHNVLSVVRTSVEKQTDSVQGREPSSIDSISFCIARETKYRQSPRKCLLKLLPIL